MLAKCEALQEFMQQVSNGVSMPPDPDARMCLGYMWGVRDLYLMIDSETKKPIIGPCLSRTTTVRDVVRVFVDYARANPGSLDQPVLITVTPALHKAFPCRA